MDSIPLWIAFVVCVILGAYFAATESSFSAVNKIKIKTLADDGKKSARGVMYVLNHFDKALTTLLVGNNITKIAGASVFTIIATDYMLNLGKTEDFINSFAFSIGCSAVSTAIIFLFSEMIPKSFANDRSQSCSLFFEGSLRFLMKVLTPISAVFNLISKGVSKLFSTKEDKPSITEDELIEILDTVEEEGVVNEEQSDMLKSVLEFSGTVVEDIMTMARDMESIDIAADTEQVLKAVREANYSRLPVYLGSPDRIVGILRVRHFLVQHRKNPNVRLRNLIKKPFFVRWDTKIDDLLNEMRQRKNHLAIVRDENNKAIGLVTIEDILEELVGEIFDEEDVVDQNFQPLGGNRYLVNTHLLVGNLYERIGLSSAPRAMASKPIISLILETFGRLPEAEESFIYDCLEVTVEEIEGGRPVSVLVHSLDPEEIEERKRVLCKDFEGVDK